MTAVKPEDQLPSGECSWREALARHQTPVLRSNGWQLVNSLVPHLVLWVLMVWALNISYWITLALAVPAAGFLVRIFIIFHDCCHASFFKSRRANHLVEFVTGVLTFSPYRQWRHLHARHHAATQTLRKSYASPWNPWTLVEAMDNKSGRRFKKARNAAPVPGPIAGRRTRCSVSASRQPVSPPRSAGVGEAPDARLCVVWGSALPCGPQRAAL